MQDGSQPWPADLWLTKHNLIRVVGALMAKEIADNRRLDVAHLRPDLWDDATDFGESGLALDSLERMNCAAALNAFFHLSDYGAEDYLLAAQTLGDWAYVVAVSIAHGGGSVTVQTSGSTGTPKSCTHKVSDLAEEVSAWGDVLGAVDRVVSLVSPHHIYGFVWSAMLPSFFDIPVVDARFCGIAALKGTLDARNTLVIGAPVHWAYLARSLPTIPPTLTGVTSTSPMPDDLKASLTQKGLKELLEIYGSSETGGIGYRRCDDEAYTLLPYWTLQTSQENAILKGHDGRERTLMDRVELCSAGQFRLLGRCDGAVQVGGVNVFPNHVASVLESADGVKECAVRACSSTGRLAAFVVPDGSVSGGADLERHLRQFCTQAFDAAQRPASFDFGHQLPRNDLGKLMSWS